MDFTDAQLDAIQQELYACSNGNQYSICGEAYDAIVFLRDENRDLKRQLDNVCSRAQACSQRPGDTIW